MAQKKYSLVPMHDLDLPNVSSKKQKLTTTKRHRTRKGYDIPFTPETKKNVTDRRNISRQAYLQKRWADKRKLLQAQVANETVELTSESTLHLSEREKREFSRHRELLRLVETGESIDDHLHHYELPDSQSKQDALFGTNIKSDTSRADFEEWENQHHLVTKAQMSGHERQIGEYDFLLDQQAIHFVKDPVRSSLINTKQHDLIEKLRAAEQACRYLGR
ncbi:hypothetical protein F4819DRAFT_502980 [Hypoxylon fuscum]|nr:hypothetical protein F4819DRAFT_502980 [Hypoxylon fuscum]